MKESTWIMLKKHGWRVDRFAHNYFYFLFYYPYVKTLSGFVQSLKYLTWCKPLVPVGRMIFDRYHSKVLSYQDTRKIFTLNENIRFESEENKGIIPYQYATRIIFQEPEYIAVMDCPCKKSTGAAAEDINSCIAVGKSVASFWLERCGKYHPRKITQAEALSIIDRFRGKGHITQAFFKVATGGSTGVICNCHPDTCVSLQATRLACSIDQSLSMTAKSGYSVRYAADQCTLCRKCERICRFGAIVFEDDRRIYDSRQCLGCELCVQQCAAGALSLYIDPGKPLPLDLDMIRSRADSFPESFLTGVSVKSGVHHD